MASYISFALVAFAISVAVSSARNIPAEPLSVMLDAYGNPVLVLREKRAPSPQRQLITPHRAMMFTGYYRPSRRSYAADQAAGVFAQGNAVSGGSYLGGIQPSTHLKNGPEPIDEPEVSSAQAEASPEPEEDPYRSYDQQDQQQVAEPQSFSSGPANEEHHEAPSSDPESPLPYDIESASVPVQENAGNAESDVVAPVAPVAPEVTAPPKKQGKKTHIVVAEEEEDDEDDEEFEEEQPYVPVAPSKGNKRRNGYVPNLNNLFPMTFTFPGLSGRGGSSSGSLPGVITAIANSYSTGKGGVASSVATAYGGSPSGKKARRAPPAASSVVAEE